jgi:hypothetical protein
VEKSKTSQCDGCLQLRGGGDRLHESGLEGLVEGVVICLVVGHLNEGDLLLLLCEEVPLEGVGQLLGDLLDAKDGHCEIGLVIVVVGDVDCREVK